MSIVDELQADAVNQSVEVTALLRKVKFVAAKLQLEQTIGWVDSELNGYESDVPDYRRVVGQPTGLSPYHGSQPVGGDSEIIKALSEQSIGEAISGLEDLLKFDREGTLVMKYPPEIRSQLLKGNYGWTDVHLEIPRSAIVGVIDRVRNMILDWALALESEGITGEGHTFSKQEKEAANNSPVNIQNFFGQMSTGNVEGPNSRINMGSVDQSTNSVDAEQVFQRVEHAVQGLEIEEHFRRELLESVESMREGHQKGSLAQAYAKFVALAANHVTTLGPFLPALAALVAG